MIYVVLGIFIISTFVLGGLIVGMGSANAFQSPPYTKVIMPPAPSLSSVQINVLPPEPPLAVPLRKPTQLTDMVVSNTFNSNHFAGNISLDGTYVSVLSRTNATGNSTVTQSTYTFNSGTRQYNTGTVTYTTSEAVYTDPGFFSPNSQVLFFSNNDLVFFYVKLRIEQYAVDAGETRVRWKTLGQVEAGSSVYASYISGLLNNTFTRDAQQTAKRFYFFHPFLKFTPDVWSYYPGGIFDGFNSHFYMRDACGYRALGETNEYISQVGNVATWAVGKLSLEDLHSINPGLYEPLTWTYYWNKTSIFFYDTDIQQGLFMKDGSVLHILHTTGELKLHLISGDQLKDTVSVFTGVTEFFSVGDLLVLRKGQDVTVYYMDFEPNTFEYEYSVFCMYTLALVDPVNDRVLNRHYSARYNASTNQVFIFQPTNHAQTSFQCLHFRSSA